MKTFLEFITESLSHLEKFLSDNLKDSEYYFNDRGKLNIEINKINYNKVIDMLKPIERTYKYSLCGYFSDFYDANEEISDFNEFRKDILYWINTLLENSDDYEYDEPLITLYFEPVYGEKISNIPNIVYHVTDLSNIDNIKSKGLLPRNTNKISYHPRRVYLLLNEEGAQDLIENFKFNIDNPVILTVDISNIKANLSFYKDINYPKGVFIDQRISPKYIINYKRVN